eukprot:gene12450-14709_t
MGGGGQDEEAMDSNGAVRDFFGEELLSGGASAAEENGQAAVATATVFEVGGEIDARMRVLREGCVGRELNVQTPFGSKQMLYADWAATGRALAPLEEYLRHEVLPVLANTHTTTSATGLQSSCYRLEARTRIAEACNARVNYHDKHSDVVLFAGTGSTGAVNCLVQVLGLQHTPPDGSPAPVVFVGPYEHHSNLLPWRESAAEVVTIPEDAQGHIDQAALARALEEHAHRPLRIGSFCAASNITGVLSHVDAVTEQLHRAGALAFWDYATLAPYAEVDMNPMRLQDDGRVNPWVYKDAVFVSPHKFPGGAAGCPGLLLAKRALFRNAVPSAPGGGTVFFVTGEDHRYLSNREEREEGGTQDIVGSIRCGLAFQVKQAVGCKAIASAEAALTARVHATLGACSRVVVLGPPPSAAVSRLPIVSFLVRAPPTSAGANRFLHYNFVCAVLNDLFGIQTRGGCMCAGPYGLELLGISPENAHRLEALLLEKVEVLRPGFSRFSLPYFTSPAEVEYVLEAVTLVAEQGWRLLPHYQFNHKTGEWKHWTRLRSFPERKWLAHLRWPAAPSTSTKATPPPAAAVPPVTEQMLVEGWVEQLAEARRVLEACVLEKPRATGDLTEWLRSAGAASSPSGEEGQTDAEALRWFMTQTEASELVAALPSASLSSSEAAMSRGDDGPLLGAMHPKGYPHGAALGSPVNPATEDREASVALPPAQAGMPEAAAELLERSVTVDAAPADAGEAEAAVVAWNEAGAEDGAAKAVSNTRGEAAADRAVSHKHPLRSTQGAAPAYTSLMSHGAPGGAERSVGNRAATEVESLGVSGKEQEDLEEESEGIDELLSWAAEAEGEGEELSAAPTINPPKAKKESRFAKPPPKLMRLLTKAVAEWDMIRPRDRLLLGLSGGKDSLALLHCLVEFQSRFAPSERFELACATVDPGTEAYDPKPLIPYLASLGVTYHYLDTNIMEMASSGHMRGDSICAFCSRMKRGALYSCCREHGYNVLVLGQ